MISIQQRAVGTSWSRQVRLRQHISRLKATLSREPSAPKHSKRSREELLKATVFVTSTTLCTGVLCFYLQKDDAAADVDYGDVRYWQDRYEQEWYRQPHDWLGSFDSLKPWLEPARGKKRIIHLGCGTSLLAEDMADAWECGEVWNVDVSESCVQTMQARDKRSSARLHWVQGDVREMRTLFEDGFFDCAIDKSTLDSVCDCNREADAARYVSEVARILNDSGVFVVFSFSPPSARLQHLQTAFQCNVQIAEDQCFVYTCCKRPHGS